MIECNAIKEQRTANRRLVKKRVQCLLGVLCFVLSAEQYSSRQDFITKSIQDSYKVLENKIIEFPTQWTSWLTIQNLFLLTIQHLLIKTMFQKISLMTTVTLYL